MALTQPARSPGPSWDEEVVPALRKRLEIESRTLARRISGISLSGEEVPHQPEATLTVKQNMASSTSPQQPEPQNLYTPQYSDRKIPKPTIPRVNGSESSSKLKFERTRTYSSPYASALPNGQALINGNAGHKKNASKSADPPRSSISRRPSDVKPTRIPKAARGGSFSNGYSPSINGNGHNPRVVTPPQPQSPEMPNLPFPEQRGSQKGPQRAVVAALPTPSSRQGTALLNESPPFTSISSMVSFSQHDHEPLQDEAPPRPSIDSEERPYEHWYRGEVSRNGGVGELRVGRRQEMLDIANYGHMIAKNRKPIKPHVQPVTSVDEPRRHRKRADSIGGMTDKEREERGSLYLDDEHATNVGYVLDESPLTDLDGEGSDINSGSEFYEGPYAYIPEVEDNSTPLPQAWALTPEARSLTPTSIPPSMIPRPSSRQHQQSPPPRIPAFSSRPSSESPRSTTPQTTAPMIMTRGASEPAQLPSSSKTPSPPPATPSSSNSRQHSYNSNTLSTSTQKGGASPASKKSRTTASKATRTKTSASRKEQDEQNRISVAYYPTPAGHGDGDMADAIPSWTQPVHRERNWDEVVLPVVARKKGLDEHYESADGNPQPKKVDNTVAPAAGTFGYDHSKYRPPRDDTSEPMPMDEFGLHQGVSGQQQQQQQQQQPHDPVEAPSTLHEEPSLKRPPSVLRQFSLRVPLDTRVAPFMDDMDKPQQQQQQQEKVADEVSGGCCSNCIIM